jgi:hypothetical protein
MSQSVKSTLTDQFHRTLNMFQDAVQAFPPLGWYAPNQDSTTSAGIALHTLETIEFYFSNLPANEFPWGQRFDVVWESKDVDRLPTQAQTLVYLGEIQEILSRWLDVADLMATDSLHPYTGDIALGRALYVLRHTQHHTADLARLLTQNGCPAPEWR